MELRQLRYLVAIIELGSFSRASDRLGIVQPALSQQIANLEAELTISLLNRSSSGVTPTEAGRKLYDRAKLILREVRHAKVEASTKLHERNLSGHVTIGLPPSLSAVLALPLIQLTLREYPGIRLHLIERMSSDLLGLIINGQIDIAFLFSRNPVRGLYKQWMFEEELCFVAAGGRDTAPITVEELAMTPVVVPASPHALRESVDTACDEKGLSLLVLAEVDSLSALVSLAESGTSNVILNSSVIERFRLSNRIHCRPIRPRITRPMTLYRSDRSMNDQAVTQMQKVLVELFNKALGPHSNKTVEVA